MTKYKWQILINSALFISFSLQAITSIFLFLGRASESIEDFHKYNGIVLIMLAITHISLNWNWIKAAIFKK